MTALPDPIADRKTNTVVIGQMLASSFLWASAFLLLKIIGGDLSPMVLTAARGVMGGGLLAGWLLILGQTLRPQGREWRDWPILGLLQGSIPNVLTAYALSQITTGLSAMIQASTPLLVAVIAHGLFADERLTARRGLGVLVGFAGMALLIGPTAFAGGQVGLFGVLAMAGTALSYAIGNVYIRTIPAQQPLRLAFGQQTLAGLPTLAVVLATGGLGAFEAVPDHLAALLALGIFGTALPIVLYMQILRSAGPIIGSMISYFIPVWTVLLGWAVLHEGISPREVAAGSIVLAGVAIASSARRPIPLTCPIDEARPRVMAETPKSWCRTSASPTGDSLIDDS